MLKKFYSVIYVKIEGYLLVDASGGFVFLDHASVFAGSSLTDYVF